VYRTRKREIKAIPSTKKAIRNGKRRFLRRAGLCQKRSGPVTTVSRISSRHCNGNIFFLQTSTLVTIDRFFSSQSITPAGKRNIPLNKCCVYLFVKRTPSNYHRQSAQQRQSAPSKPATRGSFENAASAVFPQRAERSDPITVLPLRSTLDAMMRGYQG